MLSAVLLGAGGCGADFRPMAFPDELDNPTFPGLFTGEAGEWVIHRQKSRSAAPTRGPE